ncbi:hypothetical protein AQJ30_33300 [Streptomyces longwoodensis]|uniref:Lipoprotein n=1 Tax=Streptomyces longwoodensis TaxID=68231 RepID=A0A124HPY1_9ACTN|nr:hypothetical protein [Streptomyces longwoodensis]KUN33628.1 hypothetical protein AQJ30_33300 [Streptomyces longwoodensis]
MKEAVRKTLTFSAIAILAGVCGCIAGVANGDVPPIAFGAVAIAGGGILAVMAGLATREGNR